MAYTEIQKRGKSKFYYRTVSIREGKKVSKKRKYMGKDLNSKELARAETEADRELRVLESLLTTGELKTLEKIKAAYNKEPKSTYENRYEAFVSLFTHDSTAIEGNTLTLQETGTVLFDTLTPSGKNLKDVYEVIGHKKAFDLMLEYDGSISRDFICQLHEKVMEGSISPKFKSQIGNYRDVRVFIRGTDWTPPEPKDVPDDMKNLITWCSKNKNTLHPLILTVYFHVGFEVVHPFIDGNGRVGRLLLNFILHKNDYPMVNIPNSEKFRYYDALRTAQVDGNLRPFLEFMIELMDKSELNF